MTRWKLVWIYFKLVARCKLSSDTYFSLIILLPLVKFLQHAYKNQGVILRTNSDLLKHSRHYFELTSARKILVSSGSKASWAYAITYLFFFLMTNFTFFLSSKYLKNKLIRSIRFLLLLFTLVENGTLVFPLIF